jgi:hypothetical protein
MDYRGAPQNGSAWQSGDTPFRVLRGGSWYSVPEGLRSAVRNRSFPIIRDFDIGFRVARTLRPLAAANFPRPPSRPAAARTFTPCAGLSPAQDFRCRLAFGKCEALLDDH